jgi:hypothetical protein
MTMRRQRFPWLALILGLLLGTAGGLAYAWFLNPVSLVDVAPSQLTDADQRLYVLMVSEAYLQDRELGRAQDRLRALDVRDVAELVAQQADEALLNGTDTRQVAALSTLAEALGAQPMAAEVFSGTRQPTSLPDGGTATPTFEGVPTLTPTPYETFAPTLDIPTSTPTPDALQYAEFDLIASDRLCEDVPLPGLIQIYVSDEGGAGIPGLEILIEWEGQDDRFFTGLKTTQNPGYADFEMEDNKLYTVTLVGLAPPVVGIDSTPCADGLLPGYQLVFTAEDAAEAEEQP